MFLKNAWVMEFARSVFAAFSPSKPWIEVAAKVLTREPAIIF
jgi:hypothetical protein